jgi:hypothetical protein
MELDQTEQRIDLSGRVILADVIAATEKPDILHVFMESRGLLVLDSWLQEAQKWRSGDGSSPKEADKPIWGGGGGDLFWPCFVHSLDCLSI